MSAPSDEFGLPASSVARARLAGYGVPPTAVQPQFGTRAGPVSALEATFVILASVVFGTSVLQIASGPSQGSLAASGQLANTPAWVQLCFVAIYGCVLFLLVTRVRLTRAAMLAAPLLVLVALFPFVSILWSASPAETFRRGVALFGTCLFGFYLGSQFPLRTIVRLLSIAYAIIAAGSLAAVFIVPSVGTHVGDEWNAAWRGLFSHKNGLGGAAAFGAVLLVYGIATSTGIVRLLSIVGFAAMLVLLAKALSTTALVTFAVSLLVLLWSRVAQLSPWVGATAAVLTALMGSMILTYGSGDGLAEILAQFGKSADISGRTPLWALAWESVVRSPIVGYGYEAFWVPDAADVKRIQQVLRFVPFYSHNGVLETLLSGGAVLLSLVLLLLIGLALRGIALLILDRAHFVSSFPLVFAIYFAMSNVTESRVLGRNDLVWAIFCAMVVVVGRQVRLRYRGE